MPTDSPPEVTQFDEVPGLAVDSKVSHRQVGQRVYVAWLLSGTYAEEVLCQEFQTHPQPEDIPFG